MSLRLITSTAKKEVPSIASLWTNHPVSPPKDPKKILSLVKKANMTKAEAVMEKIAISTKLLNRAYKKSLKVVGELSKNVSKDTTTAELIHAQRKARQMALFGSERSARIFGPLLGKKAELTMEKNATSPMRIINAVTKRVGAYSPSLESKLESGKSIAMGFADKKTTKQLTKNLSLAPLSPGAPSEHDVARTIVNSVQSNIPNPNKLHPEVAGYFKRQMNTLDKNLNVGEIAGMVNKSNRILDLSSASALHRFNLAMEAGTRIAPEPTRIKAVQGKMMSSVLDRANNIITQLRQTK